LYDAARSAWLLRLIRPAWDSCSRYRPVLLAKGAVQDRHEELDVELLDACIAHDAERAARALHDHLETAADIYAVELKGRSIFAW
jgi:DNA-binding GntR family transcriptional regulator